MAGNIFDILILNGRPASGKSETIDFLKKTSAEERREKFHIGSMDEIDDFPMLWTWFEEDAILEKLMGHPRMHTDKDGFFLYQYQWDLLIERISLDYSKRIRDIESYHDTHTALLEFSRGTEHGGYESSYKHLSEDILKRAAILYIDVTYEESLRKNRRRFNPDRPDSILEHGLPDWKLEKMYHDVDWETFKGSDPEYITIRGIKVPYAVLHNVPEVTDAYEKWEPAFTELTAKLWKLWNNR